MQYILETGNSHKVDIFKKFVASEQVMELAVPHLHVIDMGNEWVAEALLSQSHNLLEFVQYKSEQKPGNETILSSRGASVCVFDSPLGIVLTPKHLTVLPSPPPAASSLHTMSVPGSDNQLIAWYSPHSDPYKRYSLIQILTYYINKSPDSFTAEFSLIISKATVGFHMLLFKRTELIWAHSYDQSDSEDVLYFCLAVLQDLSVSPLNTHLYFSVRDYDSRHQKIWQDYFRLVLSLEEIVALPTAQGSLAFDLKEFALMLGVRLCV